MSIVSGVRWKHLTAVIAIIALLMCLLLVRNYTSSSFRERIKQSVVLSSMSSILDSNSGPSTCVRSRPCQYSDRVDLRIIVLTLNRSTSLLKLLESLDVLELDGHSAALEIWIDRQRRTDKVDERTVKVASEFQWSRGPSHVHVHTTHVGIYGQWIDTWRPHDDSNDELALILEDDLSISKYAYRWVRAVYRAYSHRADFAAASVTGYQSVTLSDRRPQRQLSGPKNHTVLMYKGFSSWGLAPKPLQWRRFQDWYYTHKRNASGRFHPYVPGTLATMWYKRFEARRETWTMWTMWFLYYMYVNKLYSVYNNLSVYTGSYNASLSINRFEVGLHVPRHKAANTSRLLSDWKNEYVDFPNNIVRLDWDGSYVPSSRRY